MKKVEQDYREDKRQSKRHKKKEGILVKAFLTADYIFMALFAFLCIYPFYYVIIYSLSDPNEALKGVYFWPKGFSLINYKNFLFREDVWRAFLVSVSRTVIGTAISTFCTAALAYLMTKQEIPGRKIIYRFFIITMYVSGGLIPWYLTMNAYGLKNTFLAYVLPGAVGVYNMILVKTYMEQLPESLEEAALIEGAGIVTIFTKIVLPLSKPIVATITVYNAVAQWNNWTDNFYLVQNPKLQTLQLMLNNYLRSAEKMSDAANRAVSALKLNQATITPAGVRMTIIVVSVLPIMLVYPFAQKYFTKGIMMGAVKG